MTYFLKDPEQQRKEAEERLASAITLRSLAREAYAKNLTHENRISLKAACRLVKECEAELGEWNA